MSVAGSVLSVWQLAVNQNADVLLVVEKVVQAVGSESIAPLGFQSVPVQAGNNGAVGLAVGILLKDAADNLRLILADLQLPILNHVTQSGLAAGVLTVASHKAHLLHGLLAALQCPNLIKQCHAALGQKIGGIAQVFADNRLRDGYHLDAHGGQLIAESKPRGHFAEHAALVIDNHCIADT